jgi:hypothetical protein
LQEIEFVAVSSSRRAGRVTWKVEFGPRQLGNLINAALEAEELARENEELRDQLETVTRHNAALSAANEKLIENAEVDLPEGRARRLAASIRMNQMQKAEGKGSVRTCSGGLPSLGRR